MKFPKKFCETLRKYPDWNWRRKLTQISWKNYRKNFKRNPERNFCRLVKHSPGSYSRNPRNKLCSNSGRVPEKITCVIAKPNTGRNREKYSRILVEIPWELFKGTDQEEIHVKPTRNCERYIDLWPLEFWKRTLQDKSIGIQEFWNYPGKTFWIKAARNPEEFSETNFKKEYQEKWREQNSEEVLWEILGRGEKKLGSSSLIWPMQILGPI